MKRKELIAYLLWCFILTWIFFGIRIANSYIEFLNEFAANIVNALGAFMPTMTVIILLNKYDSINGRRKIYQFVCDFPQKISTYGFLLLFMLWRLSVFIINGDMSQARPLYMLAPVILIQLLFQGGFEEPGWRGFLQPYFDKKFPFFISVFFVSVLWAVWHIPLWFVANTAQSQMSFMIFYAQILINSFTLAAILKVTNSVVFCMLYHAWGNAVFLIIPFEMNLGIMAGYSLEAAAAIILCLIYSKKQ